MPAIINKLKQNKQLNNNSYLIVKVNISITEEIFEVQREHNPDLCPEMNPHELNNQKRSTNKLMMNSELENIRPEVKNLMNQQGNQQ